MTDQMNVMLQDQLRMLEALYEIMLSSEEADIVRVSMQALTSTEAGRAFLAVHPITL